jgi:hypothetical protein
LVSVKEVPTGGIAQPYYLDGIKYLNVASREEFAATIEAFSAPDAFAMCDGSAQLGHGLTGTQQPRRSFGFSYRSIIANDLTDNLGYKIHLVYNAMAKPSARSNGTIADTITPVDYSWDITTVPPMIGGFMPSAHFIIDSTTTASYHLTAIEDILYGVTDVDPRLPSVTELLAIFAKGPALEIIDNGDGTFTANGDTVVITSNTFTLSADTLIDHGDGTFTVSS